IPWTITVYSMSRNPYTTLFRSLEEIAENDYNLNIPRYVDTFEEEEPVDLEQVQSDLKTIEAEIKEEEQEIEGYLKELGVVTHDRSEEHTSELQSRFDLVCHLLL